MPSLLLSLLLLAQNQGPEAIDLAPHAAAFAAAGLELDIDEITTARRDRDACHDDVLEQSDWFAAPGHYDFFGELYRSIRIPLGKTTEEVRESIAAAMLVNLVAYYMPTRDEFVLLEGGASDLVTVEDALITHELVHAWRDQRSDLVKWFSQAPRTYESSRIKLCVSEGEAEAMRRLIELGGDGDQLNDVDMNLESGVGIGSYAQGLPYRHGLRLALNAHRRGGLAAMDAMWSKLPVSTEQIMHPAKYGADVPTKVALPDWPADLVDDDVELVHETVLGEMGLLSILIEAGVDRTEAERATIGWDGDLVRLYRFGERTAIVARFVWDRELDAEQFATALDRAARGSVEALGRQVHWVHSSKSKIRTALAKQLAQDAETLEPVAEDVASTEAIEAALAKSEPHIADGRWMRPRIGYSMQVPDGFESLSMNGMQLLAAEERDSFRDNFNILTMPLDPSVTRASLSQATGPQLEPLGYELDSMEELSIGPHEALLIRYHGTTQGYELAFVAITILDRAADSQVVLTATYLTAHEAERAEVMERALRSVAPIPQASSTEETANDASATGNSK